VEYIHVLSDWMHPNNKLCMKVDDDDDDDDDDLDSLAYIVYNSGGTTKKSKGHCRLSSSWSRLFLAILNGVMRIFPTTKQELTSFNNKQTTSSGSGRMQRLFRGCGKCCVPCYRDKQILAIIACFRTL
jgi:hypothetical protein